MGCREGQPCSHNSQSISSRHVISTTPIHHPPPPNAQRNRRARLAAQETPKPFDRLCHLSYLRERLLCMEDSSYRQWFRLTDESEGKWRQLLIQGTRQWQSPLPLCDQAVTRDKRLMCLSGCGIAILPLYAQPISLWSTVRVFIPGSPQTIYHTLFASPLSLQRITTAALSATLSAKVHGQARDTPRVFHARRDMIASASTTNDQDFFPLNSEIPDWTLRQI